MGKVGTSLTFNVLEGFRGVKAKLQLTKNNRRGGSSRTILGTIQWDACRSKVVEQLAGGGWKGSRRTGAITRLWDVYYRVTVLYPSLPIIFSASLCCQNRVAAEVY